MDESIVKVHCRENKYFGTGFVIKSEQSGCYILTCGHVINNLKGQILVDDKFARVEKNKYNDGLDIALLFVDGMKAIEFGLIEPNEASSYTVHGFTTLANKIKKEPIKNIKIKVGLSLEDVNGYVTNTIKIFTTENITNGYSGSPIICNRTGLVAGIVQLQENNNINYGISNSHVLDIINVEVIESKICPKRRIRSNLTEENIFYISKTLEKDFQRTLSCFSTQNCTWVEPKLYSDDEKNKVRSEYINVNNLISNPRSIMINGRQQYGLTSLAKFMVKEAWNNLTKGFWLYLDASELKANKKSIERYVNDRLFDFSLSFDDIECIVIDEVSHTVQEANKILMYINEIFIDLPIVVMYSICDSAPIASDNISIERHFEKRYIWSLTRSEIRSIVSSYNASSKYIGSDGSVVNRLTLDFEFLNIPRTPLNCLTFLKIYEYDFDESPVNRTGMISKVLYLLFNIDDIPKYKTRPDLKDSEYVLGFFCEKIIREHKFYFTRDEFLSVVSGFCRDSEIDLEIEVIFDVLAANNIIVQRLNDFCFKFSYWVFYFAAHRMHQDSDFCNFIFNDMQYASYPEIIEYYTGIDRRRDEAIGKLCTDIKTIRELVEEKCQFPDDFDIYSSMRWEPSLESLEEVKEMMTLGAMNSSLPDEIKDSYADKQYNNIRPLSQDVHKVLEEYSLLRLLKTLQSASKALRNSDYVKPELKHALLDEILVSWDLVAKFLVMIAPALAKSRRVTVGGASFVLESGFDGSFEDVLSSLLPNIPVNVIGWFQDDVFSKKMGTLIYKNASNKTNSMALYYIALLLISKRPDGWGEYLKKYITNLNKNSFYLYSLFRELTGLYKYGFIDRKELEEVGCMIKATIAKHNGVKSLGVKAINKVPDSMLPERIET
ncbi:TPA: serine protease [Vibrio cholerae]